MKFKIDENLPLEVAVLLREAGHDALTAGDEGLSGARDEVLWSHCLAEERSLVTLDLDFADIRLYLPQAKDGLIVFRTAHQSRLRVTALGKQIVPLLETEPLHGRLWIVEEGRVRIRAREE